MIVNHFITSFTKILFQVISKYDRIKLLEKLFWQREQEVRKFYSEYSVIRFDNLAVYSLSIKKLFQNLQSTDKDISEESFERMIGACKTLLKYEEYAEGLEADNHIMLKLKSYNKNNLAGISPDDFLICETEHLMKVRKILAKYNILPEKEALAKMQFWAKDLTPVTPGSNRSKNSQETITRFYEFISNLSTAFFKNQVYLHAFGISTTRHIEIDPFVLQRFVTAQQPNKNETTRIPFRKFLRLAKETFGEKSEQFVKTFVLSEDNIDACPLYMKMKGWIFCSQHFSELFTYPLYAISHQSLFNAETEKRSKMFESQIVKKNFEQRGFRYLANHIVKGKMEIDGIAISPSIVYVIEVKGWKSTILVETVESRTYAERDIRNAIDGLHITHKTGQIKKKVPLPQKVQWVAEHRKALGISEEADVQGMLVINREPAIVEYKGCIVQYLDDFDFN